MKKYLYLVCSLLFLLSQTGCQPTATVEGTVAGGGKAVDGGSIILQPVDRDARPAAGNIEKDGSFVARTAGDNGITPGNYKVLFTAPLPVEDGQTLGPPSHWRSWRAPSEPVLIEPGENRLAIELIRDQ